MKNLLKIAVFTFVMFVFCGCDEFPKKSSNSESSCAYQKSSYSIGWVDNVTKSECQSLAKGGWYSTEVSYETAATMNYRCSYGTCPW